MLHGCSRANSACSVVKMAARKLGSNMAARKLGSNMAARKLALLVSLPALVTAPNANWAGAVKCDMLHRFHKHGEPSYVDGSVSTLSIAHTLPRTRPSAATLPRVASRSGHL